MPATLIGDLVGSRRQPDRVGVQARLAAALASVNALVPAEQPLRPTVGDEFQATYAGLGEASLAALLVRLTLLPTVDSRYGLGWGPLEVFTDNGVTTPLQDGPAWWAARDAIVAVKEHESARRGRHVRTLLRCAPVGEATPDVPPGPEDRAGFVNAFLICRDAHVGALSARGHRLLLGLLTGHTQTELAAAEGITRSAVSQHVATHDLAALVEAHRQLGAKAR